MALLDLLIYPHPTLSETATAIEVFDETLEKLASDMAETMYAGNGVGLAAPQIGQSIRMFLVDVAPQDGPRDLKVFINPKILSKSDPVIWNEGCLSLPGLFRDVPTYAKASVEAQDLKGETFQMDAEGLQAVAILHEYRHLDGEMFIDRLSPMAKRLTLKYWRKNARSLAKEIYTDMGINYIFHED